ncbi:MAG: DUF5668 domain-containing protein [Candidatus Micrarchaeota archaeon]
MFGFLARSSLFNLFLGVTLIVFGLLFLLSNYNIIPAMEWNKVWPIILVILGATFLLRGQVGQQRDSNWL